MRVKDKVAIVVGGASGIGRATAQLLAREGAKVMIANLHIEKANQIAKGIKADGGEVATIKADMTIEKEVNEMVRATLDRFGRIDILANVAGGSVRDPFPESTKETWERMIDLNLTGARNCTRAVINHMMERGSGKIVNVSSIAGLEGAATRVSYAAAKAGLIGFTKALALEMNPMEYRLTVSPRANRFERMLAGLKARAEKGQMINIDKLAKPEEMASVILLLVSDELSHVSGENFVVAVRNR
jgi:NAD(P)-dependent dehydrogenase (short-subunit alcohol dehydrogenase family)